MTGGNILSIGEKDYGIVPRAVRTIFDTIQVSYSFFVNQCEKARSCILESKG
jgi:hypothetical protein